MAVMGITAFKERGYRCGWKRSDKAHFYRFTEPRKGYPVQIELFSRKPDYHLEIESGVVPIYIDDDVSSLSAIMLNDDFYNFMMDGRKSINGISIYVQNILYRLRCMHG